MMKKAVQTFILIFLTNLIKKSEMQIVYTKDLQDWDEDGEYWSWIDLQKCRESLGAKLSV